MDCSPPGPSVHEIFQARILEWVAFPSPGGLPNPGIEAGSPALQADSLPTELQGKPQRCPKSHVNGHSEKGFIKCLYGPSES